VLFKKRHLRAVFADGRTLDYPVKDFAAAVANTIVLKGGSGNDQAICVDLIGESWNYVPGALLGQTLTFKDGPYTNLPPRKTFKSWTYDYQASVTFDGSDDLKLVARIPTDNTELETCQKSALENPEEGKGICTGAGLVEPRHWIIQAMATDSFNSAAFQKNKVIRKAYVSTKTVSEIKSSSTGVAGCGQCLGWQGESIPNFHLLVGN
jgi:hypothetical protein